MTFEREVRYVVTKIKTGKQVDCVVVEADWPEYETVWNLLQCRIDGMPNELELLQAENAALKAENAELKAHIAEGHALAKELNAAIPALEAKMESLSKDAVHEGWVLVPITPTPKMIHAAYKDRNGDFGSESQWNAMIAAAPKPDTPNLIHPKPI